jgi:hypothetical protein
MPIPATVKIQILTQGTKALKFIKKMVTARHCGATPMPFPQHQTHDRRTLPNNEWLGPKRPHFEEDGLCSRCDCNRVPLRVRQNRSLGITGSDEGSHGGVNRFVVTESPQPRERLAASKG